MKKVFLLALALCATMTKAEDMAMNCTQQGFQVGIGFGYGLTTPSNTVYDFAGSVNTPGDIQNDLNNIVSGNNEETYDIAALTLDYSNVSTWQSTSAILGSFNIGYKTFFDCNKYSVTGNAFIMMNSTSMTSNLMAELTTFQVEANNIENDQGQIEAENTLVGGIGSAMQYAGKLKLTSGAVFGFNVLLAKEFSWGNAGLLLGMKFNSYKLSYLQTNPETVPAGVITAPGYIDITADLNDGAALDIANYTSYSSKTKTATGFTIGFATNYYISDNLSAGLTLFYDMYAPITFNLNDISVSAFTIPDADNVTDSGKIKFQNNTIGVMMNLTYSFGAN
jgi:hypothetical protein